MGQGTTHISPSRSLHHAIDLLSDNPTSVREAVAFYADYYDALREMARVTRNRIIIVIGNRVLNNRCWTMGKSQLN